MSCEINSVLEKGEVGKQGNKELGNRCFIIGKAVVSWNIN